MLLSFTKEPSLMTNAEAHFFSALDRSVGRQFRIFSKVRIADCISVRHSFSPKQWRLAFNSIAMKHFDFVLCDNKTNAILLAIELDDKSHEKDDRRSRDKLVNHVCQKAGLPLLRVKAARYYDYSLLAQAVSSSSGVSVSQTESQKSHSIPAKVPSNIKPGIKCQKCQKPMVRRSSTNGTGDFWDCATFPPCNPR